ncbi:hypothetical protein SLS60_010236 [Paraconiothyrium brasiliense]|uniref:Uncharacterized protein n=1 Tax=Paraconiothyrium brasiliense TaxID=300254 RepID=A0ABR3QQQ1_9PLEO
MSQSATKTSMSSSTDPLLAQPSSTESPKPIPSSSAFAINVLAMGRIGLGVASLVAPTLTFALFRLPLPANMTLLPRMFGGREIVIGEWTWMTKNEDAADGRHKGLKTAMRLNTVVDALDFASVGYGVATGTIGRLPGGLLAGGALTCIALDLWSLQGL